VEEERAAQVRRRERRGEVESGEEGGRREMAEGGRKRGERKGIPQRVRIREAPSSTTLERKPASELFFSPRSARKFYHFGKRFRKAEGGKRSVESGRRKQGRGRRKAECGRRGGGEDRDKGLIYLRDVRIAILKASFSFLAKNTEKGCRVAWQILEDVISEEKQISWKYSTELLFVLLGVSPAGTVVPSFKLWLAGT
jgi:hypothetical protein